MSENEYVVCTAIPFRYWRAPVLRPARRDECIG